MAKEDIQQERISLKDIFEPLRLVNYVKKKGGSKDSGGRYLRWFSRGLLVLKYCVLDLSSSILVILPS